MHFSRKCLIMKKVEIHLAGNNLQDIPNSFGDIENLEVLDIKKNHLKALPLHFSKLEKLKKLNLEENQLTKV